MSAIPAGTAFVDIDGRFDRLRQQVAREGGLIGSSLSRQISQTLDRSGAALQRKGRQLTMRLTAPLVALGAGTVRAASDVEEMESKFGVVFGNLADDAKQWAADHAEAVNRSRFDIMAYLAQLQDTFVPMGFARDQAADMSRQIVELGVDLASFNNIAESDAIDNLTSGLLGNHRALRGFGVAINQATLEQELLNMGIEGGVQQASEQEKMLARMNLILEMTTDAQGDAARTSESFANRMRGLRARGRDLAVMIGEVLMPVATDLVERMTEFVGRMADAEPATIRLGVAVGGALAAIGPGLLLLGTGLRGVGLAFSGIATLLTPGGLLLGGLLALGGVFVHVLGEGDTFLAKIVDIGSRLRDWFRPIIERAKGWLQGLGISFGDTAGRIDIESGNIQTSIRDKARSAMSGLRDWMQRAMPQMAGFVESFAEKVRFHFAQAGEFFDGFMAAARKNRDEWDRITDRMETSAGEFATGMDRIFGEVNRILGRNTLEWGGWAAFAERSVRNFASIVVGRFEFIGRGFNQFSWLMEQALRTFTGAINSMFIGPTNSLIRGINRILSAIGSARSIPELSRLGVPRLSSGGAHRTVGTGATAGVAHEGGKVGEDDFPTRDIGRLGPDERLFILQDGERVLSRKETHLFERGMGDSLFERAKDFGTRLARSLRDRAADVAGRVRSAVERLLERVLPDIGISSPGGVIGDALASLARQALRGVREWAAGIRDNLAPELGPGIGWRKMWAALSAQFPTANLHSAFRPGAITATGNPSYHGMGRAIDVSPRTDIANWIRDNYMAATRELIFSPMGRRQIHNGRDHVYSGITRAMHWDHVHWAMGDGGIVRKDGRFLVGENGAEVVNLNRGDYVQPLSHTMQPVEVHFHGDVYGVDDLGRRVAEALNVASRHGTRLHPRVVGT